MSGPLTVNEYAKLAKKHPETVTRLCRTGQLKAKKIGGSWRIYEDPSKF